MLWAENSFNILSLQLGPASKVRIFPPSFSPWQPQMPPMMSVGGEWATETIYRHSFLSLSVFLFLFYLYANFLNSLLCWKKNLYSQNNKFSLSLMSAFLSRLSQTESTLQTALEFLTGSQSLFLHFSFYPSFFSMFYIHILTMKSLCVCWASVKVLYRMVTCLYLRWLHPCFIVYLLWNWLALHRLSMKSP